MLVMWNSYAFVHYATMEEGKSFVGLFFHYTIFLLNILARRALDQSNGAMFLNRKLIVQLSTSRFRPQPKETINLLSQSSKKLMGGSISPSSIPYQQSNGMSTTIKQQQSTPQQFNYTENNNYDMMTTNGLNQQQSSSSSLTENSNLFRSLSPLAQDMNNYYSQYLNMPTDRMTSSLKVNNMKSSKQLKTGNSNRMVLSNRVDGSIPGMSNLLDTFANHDGNNKRYVK